jgi:histidine triad (HIT) family protein
LIDAALANEESMPINLPQRGPCPFCENIAGRHQCAFIFRDRIISSFVNPRQYCRGAVLIVPNRHAPTILDLDTDEQLAIFRHAQELVQALIQTYQASGFNVFQNNGVPAGQTVPHYHLHVVPRYCGEKPDRIFGEHRFDKIPFDERLAIAEKIKKHLRGGHNAK